jgi:thiamine pyrophosphate-dependent acetolactate synthase large subunit-like protein
LTDDQSLLSYPQALWTATLKDLNLKFIVVNSYGSKSFNIQLSAKLPVSEIGQGLRARPVSFAELARSVNLPYLQASDMSALERQLKQLFEESGPQILEVILE